MIIYICVIEFIVNNSLIIALATCLLSVITTLLTAFKYGTSITPNVLDILPRSNLLYLVILLVTLQLCLSNAVGSSALYQHLEDVLSIPKSMYIKYINCKIVLDTYYNIDYSIFCLHMYAYI